ncbi:hypothetical protein ACFLS1_07430 [Verrucomicrobiota bacterium]
MKKILIIIIVCLLIFIAFQSRDKKRFSEKEPCSIPTNHVTGISLHIPEPSDSEETFIEIPECTYPDTNLYDFVYDDVPLLYIVNDFAKISNAHIIIKPKILRGRVTLNLTAVQWLPALEAILDMHNLYLIEKPPGSGVYSIEEKNPDQPEPICAETIIFDSSEEAIEIAEAIQQLWKGDDNAIAIAIPSRKAVILKATESMLGEAMAILESTKPKNFKNRR